MAGEGILERAAWTASAALLPLTEALEDADSLRELLLELGWEVPTTVAAIGIDPAHVDAVVDAFEAVLDLGDGTPDDATVAATYVALVGDLAVLAQDIYDLRTSIAAHFDAAFLAASNIAQELPKRLFDYLVVEYVFERYEPLYWALVVLGVFELREIPSDPATFASEHTRRTIRLDRLRTLVTDPAALLQDVYGWGLPAADINLLLERLNELGESLGLPVAFVFPPLEKESALSPPGTAVVEEGEATQPELQLPLFRGRVGGASAELGVWLFPLPPEVPGGAPGLALGPYVEGSLDLWVTLDRYARWLLRLATDLDLRPGIAVLARPGQPLRILADVLGSAAQVSGAVVVEVRRDSEPDEDIVLLGMADGSGIRAHGLYARVGLEMRSGQPILFAELGVEQGRADVSLAGSDSFLAKVLPSQMNGITFDLGVAWSSRDGISFKGGVGLEFSTAVGVVLGPIALDTIYLALSLQPDGAHLVIAATVTVKIGPIVANIDQTGVRLLATLKGSGGSLGPIDVRPAFKPPRGVALSIDAGPVSGGGFLFFDPAKEQYAGGLYLKLEKLTLNAIGLLTTRLPDGSRGFSLLVIIQASGFPPIQLGYGFTLNGIGGLLGINRTVAVDVLREGVRNRSLDAILFSPDDPTPRAPQIISTLQTVFPPAANQYVFGPMAMFGWGAPVSLITVEIALILELPSPIRLIILGRVRAGLPVPEYAIVSFNLDVVGVIDFDRRELSVDGTLYDSRVGPFELSGDMAARASWGAIPDFAMSLGGFHPAFKPPPGFPELRRLALALSTGDNPRLRMEAYFALTTNTVQVGAQLELYVEIGGFSLEGGLGFDTLIQLSPFRLLAEIFAHLALKRGSTTLMGLDIHVHLTGPAPWVMWGEASFKILFVSYKKPFRATFGRAEDVPAIERQEVWPALRDSLAADGNWSAQLPPDSGQLVALRTDAGKGELLAHPLGTLTVSQNLVPLKQTIGLFGSVPPKDYDRFEIIGATGLDIVGTETQYFAPAQFRKMSDAEKLASPSFERMVSGVRLAPRTAVAFGHVQETPLDYEQSVILDVDQHASERLDEPYTPVGATVAALADHGPAATAEVREQGRTKFASPAPGLAVADPKFVVVTRDDLTPVDLDGLDGSYTAAAERLRRRADRDELQIVRAEELELT